MQKLLFVKKREGKLSRNWDDLKWASGKLEMRVYVISSGVYVALMRGNL